MVSRRVKLLCGCYRRDDAADPAIYASALVAVMEEYPIEVVEVVTDPRNGLASYLKFLPSVAEVKEACEKTRAHQRRAMEPRRHPVMGTPPSRVNPTMWDSPAALERHERDYTRQQNWRPGQGGEFLVLGNLLSQMEGEK